MPVTHDSNERQQAAIWPWILMPVVVLLVAYSLDRFKDAATQNAAQSQVHAAPTATTSGTAEQ